MARYRITSLNYITSGSNRSFLNLDTEIAYDLKTRTYILGNENGDKAITEEQGAAWNIPTKWIDHENASSSRLIPIAEEANVATELLLHESQHYVQEYDSGKKKYIQLLPIQSTKDYQEKVKLFNQTRVKPGSVFEIENTGANHEKNVLTGQIDALEPLYDIRDVSIKSRLRHPESPNISNEDGFMPTVGPDMPDYPIGFTQPGSHKTYARDAFVLTRDTDKAPYQLVSELKDTRENIDKLSYSFSYRYEGEELKTYLYRPHGSNLSARVAEAVADPNKELALNGIFTPFMNLKTVQRSYIYEVPQNNQLGKKKDTESDFDKGDIYADMMLSKSSYNSLYSMDVLSANGAPHLKNAREYIEINSCAGADMHKDVYLKFYDDRRYSGWDVKPQGGDEVMTLSSEYSTTSGTKFPYQKIEFLYPTSSSSVSKHKSTLFSVRISDTGLGKVSDSDSPEIKNIMSNIRMDIENSIRKIAENVTPANTELFKVYFQD